MRRVGPVLRRVEDFLRGVGPVLRRIEDVFRRGDPALQWLWNVLRLVSRPWRRQGMLVRALDQYCGGLIRFSEGWASMASPCVSFCVICSSIAAGCARLSFLRSWPAVGGSILLVSCSGLTLFYWLVEWPSFRGTLASFFISSAFAMG